MICVYAIVVFLFISPFFLTSSLCRYGYYGPEEVSIHSVEDEIVIYFCSELQAGQGFAEMSFQRTGHHEHERLRVAAQRVLQQVR